MERDLVKITFTELVSNFNSHAHVERDTTVFCLLSLAGISTHTLTWSVTLADVVDDVVVADFNSHAHVERDFLLTCLFFCHTISTHTLTWSVTS